LPPLTWCLLERLGGAYFTHDCRPLAVKVNNKFGSRAGYRLQALQPQKWSQCLTIERWDPPKTAMQAFFPTIP
jgi:hypothetical protein